MVDLDYWVWHNMGSSSGLRGDLRSGSRIAVASIELGEESAYLIYSENEIPVH